MGPTWPMSPPSLRLVTRLLQRGGMRVVQHKTTKDEKDEKTEKKMTPEEVEEFGEDKPVKKSSASSVLVSGAKASEEEAYPKETVKVMHDKPMPTHDKGASHKPKIIHQPKK